MPGPSDRIAEWQIHRNGGETLKHEGVTIDGSGGARTVIIAAKNINRRRITLVNITEDTTVYIGVEKSKGGSDLSDANGFPLAGVTSWAIDETFKGKNPACVLTLETKDTIRGHVTNGVTATVRYLEECD